MAAQASSSRRTDKDVSLWPWGPKAAALTAPAALILLLILLAMVKSIAGWPADDYQGWVLLGIVILSLMPLLLLLVETTVRHRGELRVLGVSLSFAAASQEASTGVRSTTLDENLGIDAADPVERTSLPVVIKALRRARDSHVTVIDLRAGSTWWESRLFILLAGAAYRGRPSALAFVAQKNGESGQFVGWATPTRLLDLHLAADDELAVAYTTALAQTRRWETGIPIPGNPSAVKPLSGPALHLPMNPDEPPDPQFALELFLNDAIQKTAPAAYKRPVTLRRLLELYEPALITDHIEVGSPDEEWLRLLRHTNRPFFALTADGRLRTLVPRDALLTALVVRLAEATFDGGSAVSVSGASRKQR